jgi:hypothetical protein
VASAATGGHVLGSSTVSDCSTTMMHTACDRLESSFSFVAAVARMPEPRCHGMPPR